MKKGDRVRADVGVNVTATVDGTMVDVARSGQDVVLRTDSGTYVYVDRRRVERLVQVPAGVTGYVRTLLNGILSRQTVELRENRVREFLRATDQI